MTQLDVGECFFIYILFPNKKPHMSLKVSHGGPTELMDIDTPFSELPSKASRSRFQ